MKARQSKITCMGCVGHTTLLNKAQKFYSQAHEPGRYECREMQCVWMVIALSQQCEACLAKGGQDTHSTVVMQEQEGDGTTFTYQMFNTRSLLHSSFNRYITHSITHNNVSQCV